MRHTTRRFARLSVVAALVAGVGVGGGTSAAVASTAGDTLHGGGCGFNTDQQQAVTAGQNVGEIYEDSATLGPDHKPTGATVECWIAVNGVKVDSTDLVASGFGVQANAKQISFAAGDADFVMLCQTVTYADGSVEPPCDEPCGGAECQFPPQWILDLLNAAFTTVNDAEIAYVDPAVCPQLVKLAGSYGPITVTAEGDVFVADPFGLAGKEYDCPPYQGF